MATNTNGLPALSVVCLATLMIVLDVSIVNVALPSVRASLDFSPAALSWVVDPYLLTFGCLLMLGGRLGDSYGPRRLLLIGIAEWGDPFYSSSSCCHPA